MLRYLRVGVLISLCTGGLFPLPVRVIIVSNNQRASNNKQFLLQKPDLLFNKAPAALVAFKCNGLEALNPLARHYNLAIQVYTPLSKKTSEAEQLTHLAAHTLINNPAYTEKTVIVYWDRKYTSFLASLLGAKNTPTVWPKSDFNSYWIITYAPQGPIFEIIQSARGSKK